MKGYFSIGELSKYQNISKQTLIFYDKIGLFRPAYVDPQNGYRYYSAKQIDYLDTILIMKKIGFPLSQIREHMEHYNTAGSLAALGRQVEVIDRKMEELSLIRSRLLHRCGQMEQAQKYLGQEAPVLVEEVPAQCLLIREVAPPYSLREISIATKECFAQAFQEKLPIFFQSGVTVPLERVRRGEYIQASHAFLPIEDTDRAENIRRLPGGKCAAIYHVGDYQSIGRSYRRLLDYCQGQGLALRSGSFEFCINDYITTEDESEYITKIQFYVARDRAEQENPSTKGVPGF